MTTQSTVKKTIEKIELHEYEELENLVQKIANSFIKKNYSALIAIAFGNRDDIMQVIWTRFLEVNKSREIIKSGIKGNKALLTTIAKRGLVDYMRTQIGRHDEKRGTKNYKGQGMMKTTYYMTYMYPEEGGYVDIMIEDPKDYEAEIMENILREELDNFMRQKLTPKENMVMKLYAKDQLNMKEIGDVMSVTESRVSQIMSSAKTKMRKVVKESYS